MKRYTVIGLLGLFLFTASSILIQTDAYAKPPWAGSDDKPGKGKNGKSGNDKPPTISGTPAAVAEVDQYYAFQATASDPEGSTLTFTIRNMPSWAAFDGSHGLLSGYPSDGDAGTVTNDIVMSVSDGANTASLPAFSIAVGESGNREPVIGGSPAGEVMVDQTYAFTPTASDPDGDALHFSASNLPRWAAFDTTSGRMHGVPGNADVGVYENIQINVSDGIASASTERFAVSVVQITNGAVTLNWSAPSQNVDGTPLLDLAGFKIYYGNVQGRYDYQLEIRDPSISTATIDNLTRGTWYFAASAFNSAGLESDFSGEAQVTVQ